MTNTIQNALIGALTYATVAGTAMACPNCTCSQANTNNGNALQTIEQIVAAPVVGNNATNLENFATTLPTNALPVNSVPNAQQNSPFTNILIPLLTLGGIGGILFAIANSGNSPIYHNGSSSWNAPKYESYGKNYVYPKSKPRGA